MLLWFFFKEYYHPDKMALKVHILTASKAFITRYVKAKRMALGKWIFEF